MPGQTHREKQIVDCCNLCLQMSSLRRERAIRLRAFLSVSRKGKGVVMKEVSVSLWEIDESDIKKFPKGLRIPVLEFDVFLKKYRVRKSGLFEVSDFCKYFVFDDPVVMGWI